MKENIDVNKRVGKSGGKAENEDGKVQIRGMRVEDMSKIIRIISPYEEVPLASIKEAMIRIRSQLRIQPVQISLPRVWMKETMFVDLTIQVISDRS